MQEEVPIDHEKKPSEGPLVFDEKFSRELMVKFCIHAEIPFLKFEDPHLQPWIDSLQPAFQIKGRHTIRDDALKMYKGMKKDIEVELQNLDSRICLTSDMWTSLIWAPEISGCTGMKNSLRNEMSSLPF